MTRQANGGTEGSKRRIWLRALLVLALLTTLPMVAPSDTVEAASPATPDALVVDRGAASLVAVNTGSSSVVRSTGVGATPTSVAVTPDAKTAYVTNSGAGTVTAVNLATGASGGSLTVGGNPSGIAIKPDGSRAFVTVPSAGTVVPIDLKTHTVVAPLQAGVDPTAIAVAPNGLNLYVTNRSAGTVTPVSLQTGLARAPIPVGRNPEAIAFTPDGSKLLVTSSSQGWVVPIRSSSLVPDSPIPVGDNPTGIAVSPEGGEAFVADSGSGTVTPIDLLTMEAGDPIAMPPGFAPERLTVTPDAKTVLVTGKSVALGGAVVPIDVASRTTRAPVTGFADPVGVVVQPDQAPVAALTVTPQSAPTGTVVTFDASASTVRFGTIAQYIWYFGDSGTPVITTTPVVNHVYTTPGNYTAVLIEVSSAGTRERTVYTGQTMSRYVAKVNGLEHNAVRIPVQVTSSGGSAIPTGAPIVFAANTGGSSVTAIGLPPGQDPVYAPPIPTGNGPAFVAVTPDAGAAVVSNYTSNTLRPIAMCPDGNGHVKLIAGSAVGTETDPYALAIHPTPASTSATSAVWHVYVTHSGSGSVGHYLLTVSNPTAHSCSASLELVQPQPSAIIPVGDDPRGIAISPAAAKAYVANKGAGTVTPIDLNTNTPGLPIPVGRDPEGIAFTPDGKKAYVVSTSQGWVVPVTVATNLPGVPIRVGDAPFDVAVAPDGKVAYVTNTLSQTITPIATANDQKLDPIPMPSGVRPSGLTITPDGKTLMVGSFQSNRIVPIDVKTGTAGTFLPGLGAPLGIAMTPDQAPVASVAVSPAVPAAGSPVSFDASASTVKFGSIASYIWYFGDNPNPVITTTPTTTHTYESPGDYTVTLITVSSGGSWDKNVFTGRTMSRYVPKTNGLVQSATRHALTVTAGGNLGVPSGASVAYVANSAAGTVSPVVFPAQGSPSFGPSIAVGRGPANVAVTGDGYGLVVSDNDSNTVTPVAVCPNGSGTVEHVPGPKGQTGTDPLGIAISPIASSETATQSRWDVYVTEASGDRVRHFVLTIDKPASGGCGANLAAAQPSSAFLIPVGTQPHGIAITPDGRYAFVANHASATVTPIDLVTHQALAPIPVGQGPESIAITPDGATAYVVSEDGDQVTPIDVVSRVPRSPIAVGDRPYSIVITHDGGSAFVTNVGSRTITQIDLAAGAAKPPISLPAGVAPTSAALSADGATLLVSSYNTSSIVPIDVATRAIGPSVPGLNRPIGLAGSVTP